MAGLCEELFRSDDLVARHHRAGFAASRVCFVTFGSYTNDHALDRQGFAEDFLRDEAIDAIHVLNRDNAWYQYPEMPECLAAIALRAGRYRRVFTYGSSMGGYAALRFARAVGADTAIAISPQYSLDPRAVPFEDRWQADVARITFRETAFVPPERQVIFHDPRMALDDSHYRLFAAAAVAETQGVGVPYAGHPVGPILVETGVLKDAIRGIVAGNFDAAVVQRAVRERRRASQHHFFMLAKRAEVRRPALQIAMLRRAAEIEPESHILSELAVALDRRGEHAEAGPMHVEAIRKVPGNVRAQVGYARHLEAVGRRRAAARLLRHAIVGQTGSVRLLVRVVQVRMALRRSHFGLLDTALGRIVESVRGSPRYGRVVRWLGRAMR